VRKITIYFYVLGFAAAVAVSGLSTGIIASAQNSNSSMPAPEEPKPKKTGRCDPDQHEQTDLSGTYTGKLKHGDAPVRDATLTISGNSLTMTSGAESHTGRITAVTTCGYTAVTIMQGDGGRSEPGKTTPVNRVVSLRAKKIGDSLTLMSVPGEREHVMFTSGGGAARPRRQRSKKPASPQQ
jgi:hypothetical protein